MTGASSKLDRATRASTKPASGLGHSAGIPSAAEDRIIAAIARGVRPLHNPNLSWSEYYRRVQATPDLVLHELREAGVLFRTSEQADWPLIIEAFSSRPYTLTVRTQMTIGGQTFGFDQQQSDQLLYTAPTFDLARHLSQHAIRATLEAVAEPFYEQAAIQFAQAIEARRAETGTGSVADESAVRKDAPNPTHTTTGG